MKEKPLEVPAPRGEGRKLDWKAPSSWFNPCLGALRRARKRLGYQRLPESDAIDALEDELPAMFTQVVR